MAIKMYKMALDMTPSKYESIKYKILKNIGNAYVKKKDFTEAIQSYEDIMNRFPDFDIAYNLILCLYTISDKNKIK
jgi:intraflagellar transport protein 88